MKLDSNNLTNAVEIQGENPPLLAIVNLLLLSPIVGEARRRVFPYLVQSNHDYSASTFSPVTTTPGTPSYCIDTMYLVAPDELKERFKLKLKPLQN
jgi:hypothetical protein